MSQILKLKSKGNGGCTPDQRRWRPHKGWKVKIRNLSGAAQDLTKISPGCLTTETGVNVKKIHLAKNKDWVGRAGSMRGRYVYDDGMQTLSPRNGTIDPS